MGIADFTEEFTAHGLKCTLSRINLGMGWRHWCGYVDIPPSHPWANEDEDGPNISRLDVHGNITYCCTMADKSIRLGFDTGHAGDYWPESEEDKTLAQLSPTLAALTALAKKHATNEWTTERLRLETTSLAQQLAAAMAQKELAKTRKALALKSRKG